MRVSAAFRERELPRVNNVFGGEHHLRFVPPNTSFTIDSLQRLPARMRSLQRFSYFATNATPFAAFSMIDATARGCDTYTAWLPLTSTTDEPARLDMAR